MPSPPESAAAGAYRAPCPMVRISFRIAHYDNRGRRMVGRRKFLGFSGLAAAWPSAAFAQQAKPKPKPEGVLVNDVHAQLNSTRVYRIVEPESIDAVRGAMKLARTEKRALCIAGGRHAMGTQQFATDGVLLDIRKMNKVLAFDTERGLIEMESGMQWPQLLEHLAAARFSGEKQRSEERRVGKEGRTGWGQGES